MIGVLECWRLTYSFDVFDVFNAFIRKETANSILEGKKLERFGRPIRGLGTTN